jgi:hypothetical protein
VTDESELEARAAELRRTVYGTPGGHETDAVGELAKVEEALARLKSPPAGSESPSAAGAPAAGAAGPAGAADAAQAAWPLAGGRRTRGILITVAAAVAVVVVGAALALGPIRELTDPPRGLAVFDRAPVETDTGPRGSDVTLDQRAASTLRHIGLVVGYDVWVFRDGTDVCMIAQLGEENGWGANCVTEEVFLDRGIRRYIAYDELCDETRPPGLEPGGALALAWSADSTEVEWSIVPMSESGADRDRVQVPALPGGSAAMTYEEWSSARLAARADGS